MPTEHIFPADQKFALAPEVLLQGFESQALLVDLESERVYQLNATGLRIADLLGQGHSVGQIISNLEGQYAAPAEDLARDVHALLGELLQEKLIVFQDSE